MFIVITQEPYHDPPASSSSSSSFDDEFLTVSLSIKLFQLTSWPTQINPCSAPCPLVDAALNKRMVGGDGPLVPAEKSNEKANNKVAGS